MAVAAMDKAIQEEDLVEKLIKESNLKSMTAEEILRRRHVMLTVIKEMFNKAKHLQFDEVLKAYERELVSVALYGSGKEHKEIWPITLDSYEKEHFIDNLERGRELISEAISIDSIISGVKIITRGVPF